MAQLLVRRILEAAAVRPAGYVDEVLSLGTVSTVGGVEILTLPDDALLALREKYKSYPAPPPFVPPPPSPKTTLTEIAHGPGTELKALLSKIGITATPTCSCNARAKTMDENEAREPGWCEANIDTIVGWLREEATKRGLPFVDMAGRLLVRRAIANARRKGAAANAEGPRLHAER